MSILQNIISAGASEELPIHIRKRVQPTNIIAIILATVIAIPFAIITSFFFPSLVVFPVCGAIVSLGCILINHFGGIRYSRAIIAIIPILLGATYNAFLSGAEDDPLPSLYLIELSFSVIPFVVFDYKERWSILLTILLCTVIIVAFPITKMWFHSPYDSTPLRSGWLATLTITLAIMSLFGCVLGMIFINQQSEKESEVARLEAEEKNQKLVIQQEENDRKTKELELAQEEEKKRQWASEGLTQISEIVRQTSQDNSIFDKLIATIVKYLQANQGGLFVVERPEDQEIIIELKACYAFERKKFVQKAIAPGEGLVGQAYLEADYLYFTDIPDNYVRITSGLGNANPTSLVIIPLKVNDAVEGILEMASFQNIEEHEMEFLMKIGEVIASYIQNQRVMLQTQRLLHNAQEQSEEMRAQEEEMRQNMEEIQATQEEMSRKENEYRDHIQRLEEQLAQKVN